jgi:histidine triad (HIT) family protein
VVIPTRHVGSLTTLTADDEPLVRDLLVVQRVATLVESEHGAAAVLTNLGSTRTPRICTSTCSGARV